MDEWTGARPPDELQWCPVCKILTDHPYCVRLDDGAQASEGGPAK